MPRATRAAIRFCYNAHGFVIIQFDSEQNHADVNEPLFHEILNSINMPTLHTKLMEMHIHRQDRRDNLYKYRKAKVWQYEIQLMVILRIAANLEMFS